MEDLLRAVAIFLKYGNPYSPFHCEHDVLWVDIDPALVSEDDLEELGNLGFFPDSDTVGEGFMSYRFGSC